MASNGGTTLLKDINPGSLHADPAYITVLNNTLYFAATNNSAGRELWKTDGTAAGTILVKDIDTGTQLDGSYVLRARSGYPQYLVNAGDILYFNAEEATNGAELWKSDGTGAGTLLSADLYAGTSTYLGYQYANSGSPNNIVVSTGSLYGKAFFDATGVRLWFRIDGSDGANISISAQSGNWNTAATWVCGSVPTATSLVQIKPGHVVTINSAVQAKKVLFDNGGKVLFSGGRLTMSQ